MESVVVAVTVFRHGGTKCGNRRMQQFLDVHVSSRPHLGKDFLLFSEFGESDADLQVFQ